MEKNKLQKLLIMVGLLCLSVGTYLRAVTTPLGNVPHFLIGFLVGIGITLMIGGFIKLKNTKSV